MLKKLCEYLKEILFCVVIGFSIFLLCFNAFTDYKFSFLIRTYYEMETNTTFNCSDMNLKKTVKCVMENTREIYNYTITNKLIDFDTLLDKGGDCFDWTNYYISVLTDYGFNYESISIETGKAGHVFAIVYDDTGYCHIDLDYYKCFIWG